MNGNDGNENLAKKSKTTRNQQIKALHRQIEMETADKISKGKSNAFNDILGTTHNNKMCIISEISVLLDEVDYRNAVRFQLANKSVEESEAFRVYLHQLVSECRQGSLDAEEVKVMKLFIRETLDAL